MRSFSLVIKKIYFYMALVAFRIQLLNWGERFFYASSTCWYFSLSASMYVDCVWLVTWDMSGWNSGDLWDMSGWTSDLFYRVLSYSSVLQYKIYNIMQFASLKFIIEGSFNNVIHLILKSTVYYTSLIHIVFFQYFFFNVLMKVFQVWKTDDATSQRTNQQKSI